MSDEKSTHDDSDQKTSPFNMVSEIQYDLISRVIPGFILLSAIALEFVPFEHLKDKPLPNPSATLLLAVVVFIFMVSYAVGMLLSSCSHYLVKWFCRCFEQHWANALRNMASADTPSADTPSADKPAEKIETLAKCYGIDAGQDKDFNWYLDLMTNMIAQLKTKDKATSQMLTGLLQTVVWSCQNG